MAIVPNISNIIRQSSLTRAWQGETFKVALIKADAVGDYDQETETYDDLIINADEVLPGGGYPTGGYTLTPTFGSIDPERIFGFIRFDDVVVANATFSTSGMLIYISSVSGNPVLGVWALGDGEGDPLSPNNEMFTIDFSSSNNEAAIRYGLGV